MESNRAATIIDAPDGCGYRVHYVDRTGCATYASTTDYPTAQRFAVAIERDENDAMNGRISAYRTAS